VVVTADIDEFGTWSAEGSALTITPDGGASRSGTFCATNTSLGMINEDQAGTVVHSVLVPVE
jgi:hypothetical protein